MLARAVVTAARPPKVARCPCCRQLLPASRLLVDLNNNLISDGATEIKTMPRVAEMAHMLVRAMPSVISYEVLIVGVLGQAYAGDAPAKVLHSYACFARKAFRQLGYDVKSTYSCGYRLVPLAETRL